MRLLCFSFTENGVAIKLSSRPCNTADEMVGAPGRSVHERRESWEMIQDSELQRQDEQIISGLETVR
jgi:hypothetical protein